jgi:hypothetical protein
MQQLSGRRCGRHDPDGARSGAVAD